MLSELTRLLVALILEALGAQFGLRTPLLKVRIAIKESMGRVLTYLINEVTCFANNLTLRRTVAMD